MKISFENLYLSFRFDQKTMGLTFYIPIIMFMISLLIILTPQLVSDAYSNIIVIQGLFIPFSSWWVIYRLGEIYEDGAQETLIPYYSKRFLNDFFRYFAVNMAGVLILCSIFVVKYDDNLLASLNIIHFIILILFFMLLGSSLIVLIKNVEISLTIIMIYTVLEVITQGDYMPWPHVFLFDPPIWTPILSTKFTVLSLTVIILMAVTMTSIGRADRKPK